jgi:hypothetical protein
MSFTEMSINKNIFSTGIQGANCFPDGWCGTFIHFEKLWLSVIFYKLYFYINLCSSCPVI